MESPRASAALTVVAIALAGSSTAFAACTAVSGALVLPLVELYTSEGCSSCPPADRWLSRQLKLAPQAASYVAFHVDYWDDLGWPDRFGSAENSARQRERVRAAGDNRVYTPQVMAGAEVNARWSNDAAWNATVAAQRKPAVLTLAIAAAGADQWRVAVDPVGGSDALKNARAWVAHFHDGVVTKVGSGENRGSTLRHDRVVHRLDGGFRLGQSTGRQTWLTPRVADSSGVVAFVQAADGTILQSVTLDSRSCFAASGLSPGGR